MPPEHWYQNQQSIISQTKKISIIVCCVETLHGYIMPICRLKFSLVCNG